MYINSSDIAYFLYCPYIRKYNKAKSIVLSELTSFEENIRESIKSAENNCMLKNSDVTPRKILRNWDRIWWPYVSKYNIDLKTAKALSVKASMVFSEYCKYDISDFTKYVTIGTNIEQDKQIGNATIGATIDIVKVDMTTTKKNIVLIDFSRKNLSNRDIVLDPEIRTKAYCFYQGQDENVTYVHANLDESKKQPNIVSVIFRPSDMIEIRKMILLAKTGIENQVYHMNKWNCKECGLCKSFKF